MCGIIGIVQKEETASLLVEGMARLEYRGYDSCGLATINSAGVEVHKGVGHVQEVASRNGMASAHGGVGIAHTRWATHGGASMENAHPHLSCDGNFAVVHNGIISNYETLRQKLQDQGHRFTSRTDTEVFAHLIEEVFKDGLTVEEAFVEALRQLRGTYAFAMISSLDGTRIFCAREKSPLLLGIGANRNFIGSDVNAFLPYTGKAVALNDGEYAIVGNDDYLVRAIAGGKTRAAQPLEIKWSVPASGMGRYRHYMEKEIWEQPDTIQRVLQIPAEEITRLAQVMCSAKRNVLVGVGTTYYVALFGQYLLARLGRFAPALSSDEAGPLALMDPETVVLAISQSGETFDTLQVLRSAKAAGARTAAIVNVPASSMTREAEFVLQQNSGPEICVISTKAALAQMVLLLRLACEIARLEHTATEETQTVSQGLAALADLVAVVLETQKVRSQRLARRYHRLRNWFFLGRGIYTPIAFESALKMKEVTYLHAEGMSAGFLKHGTLSLIQEDTPCVFCIPPEDEKELWDLTMSSVAEVRARGGKIIALACDGSRTEYDEVMPLPKTSSWFSPLLCLVAGQLLAYETAVLLKRDVDRPRSLAKSVTVS